MVATFFRDKYKEFQRRFYSLVLILEILNTWIYWQSKEQGYLLRIWILLNVVYVFESFYTKVEELVASKNLVLS